MALSSSGASIRIDMDVGQMLDSGNMPTRWAELAKPINRAGLKTRMMRLVPRHILHFLPIIRVKWE